MLHRVNGQGILVGTRKDRKLKVSELKIINDDVSVNKIKKLNAVVLSPDRSKVGRYLLSATFQDF